jgi:hypothetical protein
LEINPKNTIVAAELADALRIGGRFDDAIEVCQQAADCRPKTAPANSSSPTLKRRLPQHPNNNKYAESARGRPMTAIVSSMSPNRSSPHRPMTAANMRSPTNRPSLKPKTNTSLRPASARSPHRSSSPKNNTLPANVRALYSSSPRFNRRRPTTAVSTRSNQQEERPHTTEPRQHRSVAISSSRDFK